MTDTYTAAVAHFGERRQLLKAQEECAELIHRIARALLGDIGKEEIAEEVADVEIMCAQLQVIIGQEEVDSWKIKKIARLEERISDTKAQTKEEKLIELREATARAKKILRRGDKITVTKCPGTKRSIVFDHWSGLEIISKSGQREYFAINISKINGEEVDLNKEAQCS